MVFFTNIVKVIGAPAAKLVPPLGATDTSTSESLHTSPVTVGDGELLEELDADGEREPDTEGEAEAEAEGDTVAVSVGEVDGLGAEIADVGSGLSIKKSSRKTTITPSTINNRRRQYTDGGSGPTGLTTPFKFTTRTR
ncbi:MAG: hypothetical protein WCI74_04785 [Actinomycetes bacterium]